jgi:hypothetical protein
MRKSVNWIVLGGALLIGMPTAHAGNGFSVGAGTRYSTGAYGTDTTTDIWSTPFAASYQAKRWTFAVTVPYLRVTGSGNVIPGTGPVGNRDLLGRGLGGLLGDGSAANAGASRTRTSAAGLGDVVASAGYGLLANDDHSAWLALTGKVKFATANTRKGLGTGRNDYGLSLDGYKTWGRWTPFGGVGWTRYGSSRAIRLRSGVSADAGLDYRIESGDNVGVSYTFRQRIAAGGAAQSEITTYWNHNFSDRFRLQGEALGGMTRGSPDWGIGTSVDYTF